MKFNIVFFLKSCYSCLADNSLIYDNLYLLALPRFGTNLNLQKMMWL